MGSALPSCLQGPRGYEEKLHGQKVHTSSQEAGVQPEVRFFTRCGEFSNSPNEEGEHSWRHGHGTENSAMPQGTGVCWVQLWRHERIASGLGVAQEEETKKATETGLTPTGLLLCLPCPAVPPSICPAQQQELGRCNMLLPKHPRLWPHPPLQPVADRKVNTTKGCRSFTLSPFPYISGKTTLFPNSSL